MVKNIEPFFPVAEATVILWSILNSSILTALNKTTVLALDMNDPISHEASVCHICASLLTFLSSLVSQSSNDSPEVVVVTFANVIIKCNCNTATNHWSTPTKWQKSNCMHRFHPWLYIYVQQ